MGEVLILTVIFIVAAVIAVGIFYGAVYLVALLAAWAITRGK